MPGVEVQARGLSLRTRKKPVFTNIDLTCPQGSLTLLYGPAGAGKSSLIMALLARMKFTEGHLTVGGFDLPRQGAAVRRISGLAPMGGVLSLEEGLRVSEESNRARWLAGRGNLRPGYEDAATVAGLGDRGKVLIRDLSAFERNCLAIASAFVASNTELVGVDDIGVGVARDEQVGIWQLLRRLSAQTGVTVVTSALEHIPAVGIADQILDMVSVNSPGNDGDGAAPVAGADAGVGIVSASTGTADAGA